MKQLATSGKSLLTENDLYLFNEGSHLRLYDKMGAHLGHLDGQAGCYFSVWAPSAHYVAVMGDFNGWSRTVHPLKAVQSSGIWSGFIPGVEAGARYKYFISAYGDGFVAEKADPFGFFHEVAPNTASIVSRLDYSWGDGDWMAHRARRNNLQAPISIYEVHLGSWRHNLEDGDRWLSYREIAEPLANHVQTMGFTHIEFLPLTEHPYYPSWGYQTTGYFAPTSRYGSPQDLMYLIDYLHQRGIGVILDWVPSHFPNDGHGLAYFDGTHLFEHADPQQGFHPDWKSCIFNYGRHEVRSFLLSSAMFWLDRYHIDGLRVDAVASMLYLDYSRKQGEWVPNHYGGNENLAAIYFLRRLNEEVYRHFPDTQTFAEESTAWPMVSRPVYLGGLGFGMKWDMGWMHDTLNYLHRDPVHRQYHHNEITFRMLYAFAENYVLPLSHDEVVHGKGSLLGKMPGDCWQQFSNLRLLYGYQWAQPGKKLLFMGSEWGQGREWDFESGLDWHQSGEGYHRGVLQWVCDLNSLYQREAALHEQDNKPVGFEWIDCTDTISSIVSFMRKASNGETIVVVCNFTPVTRFGYRVGVPFPGFWSEVINSDAMIYGGSGQGNKGGFEAEEQEWHGRSWSLSLTVPPLGVMFFKGTPPEEKPDQTIIASPAAPASK
ncbi:MAG: 1,4-alpha-glucan branching protein GlgB [Gemmataceae bacterium]